MVENETGNAWYPSMVPNWIDGEEDESEGRVLFSKRNPHNGKQLCRVIRSDTRDVQKAVTAAVAAYPAWSDMPPVQRGMILHQVVETMQTHRNEIARIVAAETGKSYRDACDETGGAMALGRFYAGEGQRLFGRTTTSGSSNKYAMTVRQPMGVAGLIVAANTPIANAAWKVFPALICGNAAVLKAAEDTPATAWIFGKLAQEAGLPRGVLNIIQGLGEEAGEPLVAHPNIDVLSFTGSSRVGRRIAGMAGRRLLKVSLELGGKNPLVVCDDADMENALKWTLLSVFSNAGQRCAAASRIIIFDSVYDQFRDRLVARSERLAVGPGDADDLGPVINENQLNNMLGAVETARHNGGRVLCGGHRLTGPDHRHGFYMAPTLIEGVAPHEDISVTELFGPIACLYRAKDFQEALRLANDSPYGLTACIHTHNMHRAIMFSQKVQAGVAVVGAGTYGSEPHMPFGGIKQSGNGWREPGPEALDVYSELKDIYINIDPNHAVKGI